ncbi:hypothetical protein [Brevibacterium jeotgali]|uniref:Mannosyltransferase related to Gpi18 n=1 Tax=Brevibacterium jeotgali TaxID=1262550 RepID=A0A2H1L944_9MICO|nr:hypothetical protein [Brevibacterium jeotgali]TWC03294.1 Gpi18-like mannosyltransferase [Brevibacterium jeotgali]SMY12953.1 Mannosyltransferase related to Gpi18 [Brevibacterium jeotgali]
MRAASGGAPRTVDAAPRILPGVFHRGRLIRASQAMLLLPFWLQALCVYLVSRIVSLGIMGMVVRTQPDSPWTTGTETSLNDFLNFWDGGWYETIAVEGYPDALPVYATGEIAQNQWAFYPLFPMMVRDITMVTGSEFAVVAPVLSTVCGAAAAIVILDLFRTVTTHGRALTGLAFVLFFPASPILSTAYAESLTLLLQALVLLLVVRRRYLWAVAPVFLMDLSRPIGVAFAFFMLIHLISRFRRRHEDPYPRAEVVASWALGVLSCVAALVHPLHAWIRTGSLTAYTDTEAAWHTGETHLVSQWVTAGERWLGPLSLPTLLVLALSLIALLVSPAGRTMGRTLQQFCVGYGLYLLIFFTPQTSTLRLFLPLFPLALALAASRSWAVRGIVLVAFTLLQMIWVGWLWHFTPPNDLPP